MSKLNEAELELVRAGLKQVVLHYEGTSDKQARMSIRRKLIMLMEKAQHNWTTNEGASLTAALLKDERATEFHAEEAAKWLEVAEEVKSVMNLLRYG